ncbi:hypothetical protein GCK72_019250 [Caenorhabditis remanei]|uniref:Uncharacterized protein n=1 Tax=Caenorhabditis remanei TaxID=31234 RepID=A0A6A5GDG9_CAERE|nr:hypothetical protein GCK72_019250 [Caenorhabditis remanei]KAF1752695.1 hypothetical protein GCK72_019250 [Caenorhabditis remanei]
MFLVEVPESDLYYVQFSTNLEPTRHVLLPNQYLQYVASRKSQVSYEIHRYHRFLPRVNPNLITVITMNRLAVRAVWHVVPVVCVSVGCVHV